MKTKELAKLYRVDEPQTFRLSRQDAADIRGPARSKDEAGELLAADIERLSELQDKLYAQSQWSLLLVFQAMDAAGKDSTIKHVMSGINPQGCQVHSFKAPSAEELGHDFLWRCEKCLPERGSIGIFNRSYYEEVLVVRVHPELLQNQRLPKPLLTPRLWHDRFEYINSFERHLARNGTIILKFFLHVSKEEQRKRFLKRLQEPAKHWKFSAADLSEREHWKDYLAAYEDMIRHTSTPEAPWFVIPADHKWYARLVVAAAIIETLESLNLAYPELNPAHQKELKALRRRLEREL